jgi:hypothetical protein
VAVALLAAVEELEAVTLIRVEWPEVALETTDSRCPLQHSATPTVGNALSFASGAARLKSRSPHQHRDWTKRAEPEKKVRNDPVQLCKPERAGADGGPRRSRSRSAPCPMSSAPRGAPGERTPPGTCKQKCKRTRHNGTTRSDTRCDTTRETALQNTTSRYRTSQAVTCGVRLVMKGSTVRVRASTLELRRVSGARRPLRTFCVELSRRGLGENATPCRVRKAIHAAHHA